MKNRIAIAVHGGASDSSLYLRRNLKSFQHGLHTALQAGHKILKRGGSALDAVEECVKLLEDDPLFNAGRGSTLNSAGEIEMDAAIMDGNKLRAGAVAMVRNVKNPIALARNVMTKTKHVFLSSYGALEFARSREIQLESDDYFLTEERYQEFLKENKKKLKLEDYLKKSKSGTVGAVALDSKGNLAAATSTGGTLNCLPGRIGDSCIVGAGCYANNKTCAVSGTGAGEVLINNVVAHTISMLIEHQKMPIQKACEYIISHVKSRHPKKDGIGVISIDTKGNIGIDFNTQIMKRAWVSTDGKVHVKIYR